MNIDDQVYYHLEGRIMLTQLVSQLCNQIDSRCINQVFKNVRDNSSNPIRSRVWDQLKVDNEHR